MVEVDQWVGRRGYGLDVSFPQALASGRDYDLSTMLQERELEFRAISWQ